MDIIQKQVYIREVLNGKKKNNNNNLEIIYI